MHNISSLDDSNIDYSPSNCVHLTIILGLKTSLLSLGRYTEPLSDIVITQHVFYRDSTQKRPEHDLMSYRPHIYVAHRLLEIVHEAYRTD
jgi:hypothetical protein